MLKEFVREGEKTMINSLLKQTNSLKSLLMTFIFPKYIASNGKKRTSGM